MSATNSDFAESIGIVFTEEWPYTALVARHDIARIEAAAAEAERARIRAVREAAQMAMEVLMRLQLHDLPEHRGDVDAAYEGLRAALAAIDAPGTAPAEPRCDFDCDACRSTPEAAEKMDVSEGHAIVIPAMWPRLILERERARIRAAVETMTDYSDEPDSMWVRRAVVLAAIDDEANTPEWRDDSGHWIGGNVGMPEPAIDDEAKGEPEHRPEGNEGYCACGTWVWESRRNPWRCPAAIDDEAKRPPPAGETDVAADKAAATLRKLDPHGHYFTHAAIDDEAKG